MLDSRVAIITGAASGIGLELTKHCLQKGIYVVMADNSTDTLNSRFEELRYEFKDLVQAEVCDVTKPEDLSYLAKQSLDRFGSFDWFFSNAGISGKLAPIWELSHEEVSKVLDVNLHGIIHGLQVFLPLMFKFPKRSRIINMASFYGLCSGSQMSAYAMSKHAIVALSESLYFDLQRLNKPVDVSVVCPSFANTQLLANSIDNRFQQMLAELLTRSRPAADIARHIIREVESNIFYILPDREVKDYLQQRVQAIVDQSLPYQHNMEKILAIISERALKES